MICGSSSKCKSDEKALNLLREYNGLGFVMTLGEFKFTFDEKLGEFKNNLNEMKIFDENIMKKEEDIKKLLSINQDLDKKIKETEKDLLMKLTRLFMLADLHAEIKSEVIHNVEEYDPNMTKVYTINNPK